MNRIGSARIGASIPFPPCGDSDWLSDLEWQGENGIDPHSTALNIKLPKF